MMVDLFAPAGAVRLRPGRHASLLRHHPWVYRGALAEPLAAGLAPVEVLAANGRPLGVALPGGSGGSLALRMVSFGGGEWNARVLRSRLREAVALRQRLGLDSDAVRLVHAEGDNLPGLVVDRYADAAVVEVHEPAWEPLLDRRLEWLEAIPTDFDLITASPNGWGRLRGDALVRAALLACVGSGRGVSVATKMLHLKRPRLFPVLDSFVAQMLGGTTADDAPVAIRVARATELTTHIRREGRRNLVVLLELQRRLEHERFARSLVRILDAALWLSHPAAGSGLGRLIEVKRV